jgi:phenylalanyl-tRNA synthetase beta chain
VDLVAVYTGEPIPAGSRSLTFRMTFQAPDRTLSDAEVKAALDRVTAEAVELGASVRT